MKPSILRRIRRRTASHEVGNAKKENAQEQSFFGEAAAEHFFQPAAVVQRKCAECENEEKVHRTTDKKEEEKLQKKEDKKEDEKLMKKEEKEEEKLQKKEAAGSSTSQGTVSGYVFSLSSKGNPLPAQANQFFSSRMSYDFSDVKVHTDKEAVTSAKEVNAKAYTIGNNVVFNEGQYNTDSGDGKKLMAHELAHVLQQEKKSGRKQIFLKSESSFWFKDPDKQQKPKAGEIETSAQARERVFIDPTTTTIANGPTIKFAYPSSEMSTGESANIKSAKKKIAEAIAQIIADLGSLPGAKDKAEMIKNEIIRSKLKETLKAKGPINIFIQTEPDLLGGKVAAYADRVFVNLADVGDEKKLNAAISVPLMMLTGGIVPVPGGKTDTVPAATGEELKDTLLHELLHTLLINDGFDAEAIYKSSRAKRKISGEKAIIDNFETLMVYYMVAQEELFVFDQITQFYLTQNPNKSSYETFKKNVESFIKIRKLNLTKLSKKIPVSEKVAKKAVAWGIDFLIPEGTAALAESDKQSIDLLIKTYPLTR